jgi:hypothetical protein
MAGFTMMVMAGLSGVLPLLVLLVLVASVGKGLGNLNGRVSTSSHHLQMLQLFVVCVNVPRPRPDPRLHRGRA